MFGFMVEYLLEKLLCLVQFLFLQCQNTQIKVSFGERWVKANYIIELLFRGVQFLHFKQEQTQVKMGGREVWLGMDCFFIIIERLAELALTAIQRSQIIEGLCVMGV